MSDVTSIKQIVHRLDDNPDAMSDPAEARRVFVGEGRVTTLIAELAARGMLCPAQRNPGHPERNRAVSPRLAAR